MLPTNRNGITVREIQKILELNHQIFVHNRTIQRDMNLLSALYYGDIDCFEDSSSQSLRWVMKAASTQATEPSPPESLNLTHNSGFRKKCDDIAWYLDADFVFSTLKNNTCDFKMNELFNGFYILNNDKPHSNDNDKIIVFIDKIELADDLIQKAIEVISKESSKIKSIMFYLDIDKSQSDMIFDRFKNIDSTLINKGIELVVRFRNQNTNNDREIFNEFQKAYRHFEEELKAKILENLSPQRKRDLSDDLFEILERLEELGKLYLFEEHNERLLDDFYNEWGSFLLNAAKKNIPGIRISNDAIGFDCDDSSNCENIFSIKHDDTWVFSEIHDRLCRHYGY